MAWLTSAILAGDRDVIKEPMFSLRNRLLVVTVDRAVPGYAVGFRKKNLGGYISDRRCNESDSRKGVAY